MGLLDILSRIGQGAATGVGAVGSASQAAQDFQRLGPNYEAIREEERQKLLDAPALRQMQQERERIALTRNRLALDQEQEDKRVEDEAWRQMAVAAAGDVDDNSSPVADAYAARVQSRVKDIEADQASDEQTIRRSVRDAAFGDPMAELQLSAAQRAERTGAQEEPYLPGQLQRGAAIQAENLKQEKLQTKKQEIEIAAMQSPSYRAQVSGGAGLGFINNATNSLAQLSKQEAAERSAWQDTYSNQEMDTAEAQGRTPQSLLEQADPEILQNRSAGKRAQAITLAFNQSFPDTLGRIIANPGEVAEQDKEAMLLLIEIMTERGGVGNWELWPQPVQDAVSVWLQRDQQR